MSPPLLNVQGLTKRFPIHAGFLRKTVGWVRAVEEVSFSIEKGETLGLVGESGCGKTTTGRLILRVLEPTSGKMTFQNEGRRIDLTNLRGEELRRFRQHMQLILQDPFSSLNPRMTVYDIIAEPLRAQEALTEKEISERIHALVSAMGLKPEFLCRYPHAFSGGQRQRIGIARALTLEPVLVVCDEPVSALDVSVQAQIINLLRDLQEQRGFSYLFIAHDLSVVEHISHRVAVMYAGRIVEMAKKRDLFQGAKHPYTQALMKAVPVADPSRRREKSPLKGEVADPSNLPSGCAFHPRCPLALPRCVEERPPLGPVGEDHVVACHLAAID